jgi:hypothetical protein
VTQFITQVALLLTGALALAPCLAAAQDDTGPTPVDQQVTDEANEAAWAYPKSYSIRPLTMEQGMVRANGIFTVWDDGVDTIVGMTLGGSIGVLDDLELGLNNYRIGSSLQKNYEGLVPVVFYPSAGYGNIPIYGRYRFLQLDKLDFAGDLILVMPIDTPFALEVALPFRIKPNDRLSVDTGLEVRGTFGSAKYADIRIPAIVNYNFSDRAFIAVETGVQFINLGKSYGTAPNDTKGVAMPVGFRAGGTWQKPDKHLIDLFAGFSFPTLISSAAYAQANVSRKAIDFGIWDLFVGVAFYTRPLF